MDGIQESCHQTDPTVSSASVSCVVSLLGTLEDLSNGRGLSDEQIEMLNKVKDQDCTQELGGQAASCDGIISTLKCSSLGSDSEESDIEKPVRAKHIRWQMDYESQNFGKKLTKSILLKR